MKRATPQGDHPSRKRTGPSAGGRYLLPALIAAAAVTLRLFFVFSLKDTPFFLQHFSDSRLYMQLAAQINAGGIPHAYFMSPLYPYIIAITASITGNPELWVRVLQSILGGTTVFVTYLLGRELFDRSTGLAAAAIAAVYAPFIYYDGLLLTESLQTLLITAHLYVLVTGFRRRELQYWVAAGMLFGLSVITRASIIAFLPAVFVVWFFLREGTRPPLRNMLVYALTTLAMLIPTAMHNATVEGVFMPVTSSFGFNLFAGNNESATGLYSMPEDIDLEKDPNGARWVEHKTGREMNAAEISAFWRDRAIAWMTAHPGQTVSLLFRKALLFFYPGEIDQLGLSMRFYTQEYGPVIGLPAGVFPILLILAAIGGLIALRTHSGSWIPPAFFSVHVVSTVIFFVSARLRLPIMPVLMLYAAFAVTSAIRMTREGKLLALRLPVGVGTGVVLGLFLLQPSVQQGFEQEYLKLGKAAFADGDYPEAETRFRASLKEEVTVDGLVNLGNALAAQGQSAEAASEYREALRRDSTNALAWFNFGNLRMQTGSPQYAYGYWKKAVACDPLFAEARRNLGLLLMRVGRLREAQEQLESYLTLEPDAGRRAEIEKDLETLQGMLRSGG